MARAVLTILAACLPDTSFAKICCYAKWGDDSTCGGYIGSGGLCNTDWAHSCTLDSDCPDSPLPTPAPTPIPPMPTPVPTPLPIPPPSPEPSPTPLPTPPAPIPAPSPSKLPTRVLGMYLPLADDNTKYGSDRVWQPLLSPYQQNGANVLFLAFLNPAKMPTLPPAFVSLAKSRGSSQPGSVPASTLLLATVGGGSGPTMPGHMGTKPRFAFLDTAESARAMGTTVGTEWRAAGIDGIDLEWEEGSSSSSGNLVEFVRSIKAAAPDFIVSLPRAGSPQSPNGGATNDLINHAWDASQKSFGLLDRLDIMQWGGGYLAHPAVGCSSSESWVNEYAHATDKGWLPIKVDVPMSAITLGVAGGESASCIPNQARTVLQQGLGGFVVWFASVLDAGTGGTAITYPAYDASLAGAAARNAWADALKMMASPSLSDDTLPLLV